MPPRIPHKTAPFIPLYVITAMAVRAVRVTRMGITSDQAAEPKNRLKEARSTNVSGSATTIPAFCNPMKAINRPTPAGMAERTDAGMASKIFLLRPVTVRRIKAIPSNRIMTRALA